MKEKEKTMAIKMPGIYDVRFQFLLWVVTIAIVVVPTAYFFAFRFLIPSTLGGPEAWGQFGDYFGGMLNPFLSAFALVILAATLRSNNHALKQNEKILEATKDELRLTRRQIEETERALQEQTKAVRNSAHAERLEYYARTIYREILEILDRVKGPTLRIRKQGEKLTAPKLVDALDASHPEFGNTMTKNEFLGTYSNEILIKGALGELYFKMRELNQVCIIAFDATGTLEMQSYYEQRLWRWARGLVMKGYATQEEFSRLTDN